MKLSKGWSAYIFPKNNLRYLRQIPICKTDYHYGIIEIYEFEFIGGRDE